jgi:hypothetical protein
MKYSLHKDWCVSCFLQDYSDTLMSARTIVCPECGLEAREVLLDGKVTLRFDIKMMQDRCSETHPSLSRLLCQNFVKRPRSPASS